MLNLLKKKQQRPYVQEEVLQIADLYKDLKNSGEEYEREFYPRLPIEWKELVDVFRADLKNFVNPRLFYFIEDKKFWDIAEKYRLSIYESDGLPGISDKIGRFYHLEFLNSCFGKDTLGHPPCVTIKDAILNRDPKVEYNLDTRTFYKTKLPDRKIGSMENYGSGHVHYEYVLELDPDTYKMRGRIVPVPILERTISTKFGLLAKVRDVDINNWTDDRTVKKEVKDIEDTLRKSGGYLFVSTDVLVEEGKVLMTPNERFWQNTGIKFLKSTRYLLNRDNTPSPMGNYDYTSIYMSDRMRGSSTYKFSLEFVSPKKIMVAAMGIEKVYFTPTPFGYVVWEHKAVDRRIKRICRLYSKDL